MKREYVEASAPAGPEPPTPQPEPKHIKFDLVGRSESGRTRIWKVVTKDGVVLLGHIRWYGPWRCYSFLVSPSKELLIFEKTCLRDIANFCESQTMRHRGGLE